MRAARCARDPVNESWVLGRRARARSARDEQRVVTGWGVRQRRDTEAKPVLHRDRGTVARADDIDSVRAWNCERRVVEDLYGPEYIERLAVLDGEHENVASARHGHIFPRIALAGFVGHLTWAPAP
jgi:hypothetical protein